jgi:type I restriction enzyme S subunit
MKTSYTELGKIAEIASGQGAPQDSKCFCDKGTFFIRAGSLEFLTNDGSENDCEHVTDEAAKKHRLRLFPPNTILFAKSGMSAKIGRVYRTKSPCHVVSHLAAIIPGPKIDPSYLQRWFEKHPPSKLIPNEAYPSIRLSEISKLKISIPPLSEQKRIASILDKADSIRRKRRQAIQLADEFLRSVFLDMFGDPITNPKKWEKGHIQDLCEEIVDCPHSTPKYAAGQTDFACIRSSDIQNGYMDWSSTKYVDEAEYKKRIKRLEPGTNDVIYCREGARFGNAARIPKGKTICLGQRMMLFRSNHMIATAEFIWALLNSDSIYQQAVQKVGGSASPHINVADIKKFSIFFPPLSMQQNYSIVVKKIDVMKEKFQNFSLISDQIFNSTTQHAFRGEL